MSKPTETTNDRVPRDIVRFGKHTDCRETHRLSGSVGERWGVVWGSVGERWGSVGGLGGVDRSVRGVWGSVPKRAGTRNGAHAGRGGG
jgi:hypothetical protein